MLLSTFSADFNRNLQFWQSAGSGKLCSLPFAMVSANWIKLLVLMA
jgi:hypothetical protein